MIEIMTTTEKVYVLIILYKYSTKKLYDFYSQVLEGLPELGTGSCSNVDQ